MSDGVKVAVAVLDGAQASLSVKVDAPKPTGNKALIKLSMTNTYPEKVQSARAVVFLVDDQSKVVGQSVHWVIGGTPGKPALDPQGVAVYYVTVPMDKPFVKADVVFTRIILEGGKVIEAGKGFELQR